MASHIRPAVQDIHKIMEKRKDLLKLLRTSHDPYLGLLAYQTTPLENGYTPTELGQKF